MFKNNLLFTTPIDNYYSRDLDKNASKSYINQAHFANANIDEEAFKSYQSEIDLYFNQTKLASEAKSGFNSAHDACSMSNKDAAAFFAYSRECDSSPSLFPSPSPQSGASNFLNSFSHYENYYYLKQNKNINYAKRAKVDAKFSGTESNKTSTSNSQKNFQNLISDAPNAFSPKSPDFSANKASFDSVAMSFSDKSTADEISFCLASKNLNINQKQEPAINIFYKNQTRNINNSKNDLNNHNPKKNNNNFNKNHYSHLHQTNYFENNNHINNFNEIKKTYLENFNNFNNFLDAQNDGLYLNQPTDAFESLKNKEGKIIEDDFYNSKNNPQKLKINIINNYFDSKLPVCEKDNSNKNNIGNKNTKDIQSNYSNSKSSNAYLTSQQPLINPFNKNKNYSNNKSIDIYNKVKNNSEAYVSNNNTNKSANEVTNCCVNSNTFNLPNSSYERKFSEFSEEILMNSVYSLGSEKCENSTFDKEINSINEEVCCKENKEKIKITEIFKINWKKCINIFKKFSLNSYKGILLHPKEAKNNVDAGQNKTNSAKGNSAKNNKYKKNKNKSKNPKSVKNASNAVKNTYKKKSSSDSIFKASTVSNFDEKSPQNHLRLQKNEEAGETEDDYKLRDIRKISIKTEALSGDLSDVTNFTQGDQIDEKPFLNNLKQNNFYKNINKNFNSELEALDTEKTNNIFKNNDNNNFNNFISIDKKYISMNDIKDKNINVDNTPINKMSKKKKKNKKNKNIENPNYSGNVNTTSNNNNNFNICNPIIENNYFHFHSVNYNNNVNYLYNNMIMNDIEFAKNYPNSANHRNYNNYNTKFNFVPNSFMPNNVNNNYSNGYNNNSNVNFVGNERRPFGI